MSTAWTEKLLLLLSIAFLTMLGLTGCFEIKMEMGESIRLTEEFFEKEFKIVFSQKPENIGDIERGLKKQAKVDTQQICNQFIGLEEPPNSGVSLASTYSMGRDGVECSSKHSGLLSYPDLFSKKNVFSFMNVDPEAARPNTLPSIAFERVDNKTIRLIRVVHSDEPQFEKIFSQIRSGIRVSGPDEIGKLASAFALNSFFSSKFSQEIRVDNIIDSNGDINPEKNRVTWDMSYKDLESGPQLLWVSFEMPRNLPARVWHSLLSSLGKDCSSACEEQKKQGPVFADTEKLIAELKKKNSESTVRKPGLLDSDIASLPEDTARKGHETHKKARRIISALNRIKSVSDGFPKESVGLKILLKGSDVYPKWSGPFFKADDIVDGWGEPFIYKIRKDKFRLSSSGPDKKQGTDDDVFFDSWRALTLSEFNESVFVDNVKALQDSVSSYVIDLGKLPVGPNGLRSLLNNPDKDPRWKGPYVTGREELIDGWGHLISLERDEAGEGFVFLASEKSPRTGGRDRTKRLSVRYLHDEIGIPRRLPPRGFWLAAQAQAPDGTVWVFGGFTKFEMKRRNSSFEMDSTAIKTRELWRYKDNMWTLISRNLPVYTSDMSLWATSAGQVWGFGGVLSRYSARTARGAVVRKRFDDESFSNVLWYWDGKKIVKVYGCKDSDHTKGAIDCTKSRADGSAAAIGTLYSSQGEFSSSEKSASRLPAGRSGAAHWTNSAGDLFLFGGRSYGETQGPIVLNDLWKWNGIEWTSVMSNDPLNTEQPEPRTNAVQWSDSKGRLWIYGGAGRSKSGEQTSLSDLWMWDGLVWRKLASGADRNSNASRKLADRGKAEINSALKEFLVLPFDVDRAQMSWMGPKGELYRSEYFESGAFHSDVLYKWVGHEWIKVFDGRSAYLKSQQTNLRPAQRASASARTGAVTWTDVQGNLWMLGGKGFSSEGPERILDELWKYDGVRWRLEKDVTSRDERSWIRNVWQKTETLKKLERVKEALGEFIVDLGRSPSQREGLGSLLVKPANVNYWRGPYLKNKSDLYGIYNDRFQLRIQNGLLAVVSAGPDKRFDTKDDLSAVLERSYYSAKGAVNPLNFPGLRSKAITWVNAAGEAWLFGGNCDGSSYVSSDDLWKWDGKQWVWLAGEKCGFRKSSHKRRSKQQTPGVRTGAASWVDAQGHLWLFGGLTGGESYSGSSAVVNDLWKWDGISWRQISPKAPPKQKIALVKSAEMQRQRMPPPRENAMSWTDDGRNVWIYGGEDSKLSHIYSDLWKWNGSQWELIFESNVHVVNKSKCSSTNEFPSPRTQAAIWIDKKENFWIFGGRNACGYRRSNVFLNDLWKWNGKSWSLESGAENRVSRHRYGTHGVPSISNSPIGRISAQTWIDGAGHLHLFGGGSSLKNRKEFNYMNDLWKWDGSRWIWLSGYAQFDTHSSYNGIGMRSRANMPGARAGTVGVKSAHGDFIIFGGFSSTLSPKNKVLYELWSWHRNSWSLLAKSGVDEGKSPDESDTTKRRVEILSDMLLAYFNDNQEFPKNLSELAVADKKRGNKSKQDSSYVSFEMLKDGWGNDYRYALVNNHPSITSFGPDGEKGTADDLSFPWELEVASTLKGKSYFNYPGSRVGYSTQIGADGSLWLFGGLYDYRSERLNREDSANSDLWRWKDGVWTRYSGKAIENAQFRNIQGRAVVGGSRIEADSIAVAPNGHVFLYLRLGEAKEVWKFDGNRWSCLSVLRKQKTDSESASQPQLWDAASWADSNGDFWLFGGRDSEGLSNELWKLSGRRWSRIAGSATEATESTIGSGGVVSGTPMPSGRASSVLWRNTAGQLMMFGGTGYKSKRDKMWLLETWRWDDSGWRAILFDSNGSTRSRLEQESQFGPINGWAPSYSLRRVTCIDSHGNAVLLSKVHGSLVRNERSVLSAWSYGDDGWIKKASRDVDTNSRRSNPMSDLYLFTEMCHSVSRPRDDKNTIPRVKGELTFEYQFPKGHGALSEL